MWYSPGATPLLWFNLEGDQRSRSEHDQGKAQRLITMSSLAQLLVGQRFISPECNGLRLGHRLVHVTDL
jgi:hypothetical protein